MADISDVENAIKALMLSTVYPSGTTSPSLTGASISLMRGWPEEGALNALLAAGGAVVSVWPRPGHDRAADLPIGNAWCAQPAPASALAVSTAGNVVTFSGVPAAGQVVAVIAKSIGFGYAVQAGDALHDIAISIAASIAGDGRLASVANGNIVTVSTWSGMRCAVNAVSGTQSSASRQVGARQSVVSITAWAPTPAQRDTLGAAIDVAIASNDYLVAADGTAIKTWLDALRITDTSENETLYRRDRDVLVQYSIVETMIAPPMLIFLGMLDTATTQYVFANAAPMSGLVEDSQGNILEDAAGNIGGDRQEPFTDIATDASGNIYEDNNQNLRGVP